MYHKMYHKNLVNDKQLWTLAIKEFCYGPEFINFFYKNEFWWMRKWRMGCPSNFPYNILKINNNNEYVFYSSIIRPITSMSLKPKKALSHFPALRVWDTGTRNKVVRFWVHRRADLTACKDKRNTYTFTYSFIPLHVTRVRYGSEFLSQIALDAP